jgi:hypothetical protein
MQTMLMSSTATLRNGHLAILRYFSAAVFLFSGLLSAQQPTQKSFTTAEEAAHSLFTAAQAGDQVAMLEIFGSAGNEIISSGDSVQDKNTLEQFIAEYKEMHRLAAEPDGTTTLFVGADNWPLPVPLINANGLWHFDTEAGKNDILLRRIGQNEFAATDTCRALVSAQMEYYSEPRDGKVQQYAQAFASDKGRHNGLFWGVGDGEPESPIGPLVAAAAGVGYGQPQNGDRSPFNGYYYRILTKYGNVSGGAVKSYIVNGEMIGGFAILAYPADYRSSGVMTFIVDYSGVIYQKDLGDKTTEVATVMKEYSPDETWQRTE